MTEPGAGAAGEAGGQGAGAAARAGGRGPTGPRRPKARRPVPPPGRDRRRSRWIQLRWGLRLVLVLVLVWATLRMVRKLREQEARPPQVGDQGALRIELDGADAEAAPDAPAPSGAGTSAHRPSAEPSAGPSAGPPPLP